MILFLNFATANLLFARCTGTGAHPGNSKKIKKFYSVKILFSSRILELYFLFYKNVCFNLFL